MLEISKSSLWTVHEPRTSVVGTAFRENVTAILRDEKSLLELRGPLSVSGDRGPIIGPHLIAPSSLGYHRFDRETVSRLHYTHRFVFWKSIRYVITFRHISFHWSILRDIFFFVISIVHILIDAFSRLNIEMYLSRRKWSIVLSASPRILTGVVRNVRCGMEETMNTVSAIAANDAKSISLRILLNNIADFLILFARSYDLNSARQTLVRNIDKFLNLGLDITNEKSLVQITVKTVMIDSHVDVANVTVFERSRVRYTVAYHFVYRCATTCWKLMIVQGRRITVAFQTSLVNYSIDLCCSHTDSASFRCFVENFSSKL